MYACSSVERPCHRNTLMSIGMCEGIPLCRLAKYWASHNHVGMGWSRHTLRTTLAIPSLLSATEPDLLNGMQLTGQVLFDPSHLHQIDVPPRIGQYHSHEPAAMYEISMGNQRLAAQTDLSQPPHGRWFLLRRGSQASPEPSQCHPCGRAYLLFFSSAVNRSEGLPEVEKSMHSCSLSICLT